jgi:hypothetical protein
MGCAVKKGTSNNGGFSMLIEADAAWCPHDPRLAGAALCGGAAVVRLSPGFSPWQAGSALKAHRQDRSILNP